MLVVAVAQEQRKPMICSCSRQRDDVDSKCHCKHYGPEPDEER